MKADVCGWDGSSHNEYFCVCGIQDAAVGQFLQVLSHHQYMFKSLSSFSLFEAILSISLHASAGSSRCY